MGSDWCPTCEESCTDHPSVCTICGESLCTRPAASTGNTSTTSVNAQQQQQNIQRILEQAVTAASTGGGLPLAANLANMNQGGGGGDMWETPPAEALDPNAAATSSKSRPTSKECIARIPRLKVESHSAVLHEATVTIVLPPSPSSSTTGLKRPPSLVFDAMVAEFGPVPPYSITGCNLLLAKPITGSKPSSSSSPNTNKENKTGGKGTILYMERGGITFASKALYAQQHPNVKALIIGNNVPVWPYIMRDSKNECQNKLTIPVIMIKRSDGRSLRSLLEQHTNVSTLSCSITAQKCSSSSKNNDGGGSCVVCTDTFDVGDTVIRLPFCAHVFHENCALLWLKKHNTCPYCRRELPTDDEEYERERRRLSRTHAGGDDGLGSNQWESLFG